MQHVEGKLQLNDPQVHWAYAIRKLSIWFTSEGLSKREATLKAERYIIAIRIELCKNFDGRYCRRPDHILRYRN